MKDKVAAKPKTQKAKRELTEGVSSGGTNGVPPKIQKTNGESSGPQHPDQTPQKLKRDVWDFLR